MTPWSFACPDWRDRIADGRAPIPDLPLDEELAAQAVEVFDALRLPDVTGTPTLGEAAGEWQRDIVRAVFGSLDRKTGIRRVPGVFVLVPKKNSKTTGLGAGIMLTALLLNQRPNAVMPIYGPTQEISEIAFAAAAGMVQADPELEALLHVQDHRSRINMRAGRGQGSRLSIQTFDPKVATGAKPPMWMLDEMHLLGRTPYAERVIGQIRGARTAVPEQCGIIVTTQSDEPPAGVFRQELAYARAVRDGRVENPTVLPVLYEFPEEMQRDEDAPWRDPKIWHFVNPNIGRSVSLAVLEQDYATARIKGRAEEARWASQHLNVELGMGLHAARWIGADHWPGAGGGPADLEAVMAASEVAVMGVDGGGAGDLLSVGVIGRERATRRWLHWAHAWALPSALDRHPEMAPRVRDLAAAGRLTLLDPADPDGDIAGVVEIAARLQGAGLLPAQLGLGLDPWGIGQIVDALTEIGLQETMVAVSQGVRLTGAIRTLERKLLDGSFAHGECPLMAWAVGNAVADDRGSAVHMQKRAPSAKIDPLMATLNAVDLMSRGPEVARASYLSDSPLMVL